MVILNDYKNEARQNSVYDGDREQRVLQSGTEYSRGKGSLVQITFEPWQSYHASAGEVLANIEIIVARLITDLSPPQYGPI